MDLQYVKVYAIDNKGRKVPTVKGELSFEVSGPSRLIAVDNGNHSSDDMFDGNKKVLHNGFAMAIIRAEKTGGIVTLKITSPGLKPTELTLQVK